jgi:hypothetical protein
MRILYSPAVLAVLCLSGAALAQPATQADPPRPHSLELREDDRVALQCDRFAGVAREQCLLDEGRRKALEGEGRELSGSCDGLAGPDKERCLRQGGTVEAASPNLSPFHARERSAH